MVYLLTLVIFHGYVSHNQRVYLRTVKLKGIVVPPPTTLIYLNPHATSSRLAPSPTCGYMAEVVKAGTTKEPGVIRGAVV